jgi:hypothetical protein
MRLVEPPDGPSGDMAARRAAVARLADGMARGTWFAALGEELTGAERDEAAGYLRALGRDDAAIAPVDDWDAARRIANDPEWDRSWWRAEEAAHQALWDEAAAEWGADALHRALSQVAASAAEYLHGAAAVAAARAGIASPGLIKSAAGAASQACHQAALGRAAGAGPDHVFAIKLRIFEAGRWPLGIVGGRYFVF